MTEFTGGNLKDRNVLVVGGAGYIGSVLVRRMLTRGYKVTVLDNLIYGNGSSLADLMEHPRFSFTKGDFCDADTYREVLAGITDVVLLAALVGDPICKKYPEVAKRINFDGTIRLIDYISQFDPLRFIFISTCSNYGLRESDEPASEESALNPRSLYAEFKVGVEKYLLEGEAPAGQCRTILRSATAMGLSSRMRFDLTISEFTREMVLGRKLLVYDENTWRPYCHVSDISGAIMAVMDAPEDRVSNQVFNVGSNDENYTKKMIVEIIQNELGDGTVKYSTGGIDPRNYRVSFNKITDRLNFGCEFTAESTIRNLIAAIQDGCFDDYEIRKAFYGNYQIGI